MVIFSWSALVMILVVLNNAYAVDKVLSDDDCIGHINQFNVSCSAEIIEENVQSCLKRAKAELIFRQMFQKQRKYSLSMKKYNIEDDLKCIKGASVIEVDLSPTYVALLQSSRRNVLEKRVAAAKALYESKYLKVYEETVKSQCECYYDIDKMRGKRSFSDSDVAKDGVDINSIKDILSADDCYNLHFANVLKTESIAKRADKESYAPDGIRSRPSTLSKVGAGLAMSLPAALTGFGTVLVGGLAMKSYFDYQAELTIRQWEIEAYNCIIVAQASLRCNNEFRGNILFGLPVDPNAQPFVPPSL